MAIKIGLVNGKGGVGKTTTTVNLAGYAHNQGYRVCIVDTDPQGSVRDWRQIQADNADLPTVVGIDKPTLHKELPGIEPAFDYIFVDGASKTNLMNASIIKAVDIVIIPTQPSVLDIWGASDTVDLLKERQLVTDGKPKAAFLITINKKNTSLSKEIGPALAELDIPLLKTRVNSREQYKQSIAQGTLAFSIGRTKNKTDVATEISSLFNEINALVKTEELLPA